MPIAEENPGDSLGNLLSDYIPFLPSGARRAGMAEMMARRLGNHPSFAVSNPFIAQLGGIAAGSVAGTLIGGSPTKHGIPGAAVGLLLAQALKRHQIKKVQKEYEATRQHTRLRDIEGLDDFLAPSVLNSGSGRLGRVMAYEAMKKRKFLDIGSLAEAGDAIQLAGDVTGVGVPAFALTQAIDSREASNKMKKLAAPRWSKQLASGVIDITDRLIGALPEGITRQIGKKTLGTGVEGKVYPGLTGGFGPSAIKKFTNRIGAIPLNEQLDVMQTHPAIFPKILGRMDNGFIMERLMSESAPMSKVNPISYAAPPTPKADIYRRVAHARAAKAGSSPKSWWERLRTRMFDPAKREDQIMNDFLAPQLESRAYENFRGRNSTPTQVSPLQQLDLNVAKMGGGGTVFPVMHTYSLRGFLPGGYRLDDLHPGNIMRSLDGKRSVISDPLINRLGAGETPAGLRGTPLPPQSSVALNQMKKLATIDENRKKHDQRNNTTLPAYLLATLGAGVGSGLATRNAIQGIVGGEDMPKDRWQELVDHVAKRHVPTDEFPGYGNAAYHPSMDQIVIDPRLGKAPVIAHEAGHALAGKESGLIGLLQKHVYPYSYIAGPLAGAGSLAAGLAIKNPWLGALAGLGIGGVTGAGTLIPEAAASIRGLEGLKSFDGGKFHTPDDGKMQLGAFGTYAAASLLPSILAGAAGGYIGRKRKREQEAPASDV